MKNQTMHIHCRNEAEKAIKAYAIFEAVEPCDMCGISEDQEVYEYIDGNRLCTQCKKTYLQAAEESIQEAFWESKVS